MTCGAKLTNLTISAAQI